MTALPLRDQEWLWGNLARAVRQEQPLPRALRDLSEAHPSSPRGAVAHALGEALESGNALWQAVQAKADLFSPGAPSAVRAGEQSGRLPEVLDALAESCRSDDALRGGVRTAVGYPVLVALVALSVLAYILHGLYPAFIVMFDDMGIPESRLTLDLALGLDIVAIVFLLLPAAALFVLYVAPLRCTPVRGLLDTVRVSVPLLGAAARSTALARWCAVLDALMRVAVPEPAALRLAGRASGNEAARLASERAARAVEQGEPVSRALAAERFFPGPLVWLVGSAEGLGNHAYVWPVARDLFRHRAQIAARIASTIVGTTFLVLAYLCVAATVTVLVRPLVWLMKSMGS